MGVNITSIKTASNGAWQGDNPLDYAFPLLIVQTTMILILTRSLAFLLKPLRQPKVIAEIVGGILLGPSALGRNKHYMHRIFPKWSTPTLESVASIGLLYFLFLVGLELDLASIRRSGRRAFFIALAGISLPFSLGVGVAFVLRRTVAGVDRVGFAPFLVFMGVALSITAFPVLARILAELKLLTTSVGETAMAAAAFNDIAAWVLLALAVALTGTAASPAVSAWVMLSGAGFVAFMLLAVKPLMERASRQGSTYIGVTLAGVLVSGFVADLIGIHSIFGAFVFGLAIPKDGEFADRLMERIEDFVLGLLLPLYFASSGLKTDVAKIRGGREWGLLAMVITTACAGKIAGTFVVGLMMMMSPRESLALGVLMNTKGLVELIVLNIGKERKVLNDEIFAILVLMALFTTFITTPTLMAIYKPARSRRDAASSTAPSFRNLSDIPSSSSDELRILACVHGPDNATSLISLVESIRSANKSSRLKLFMMHLVELTERSSSIAMVHRFRRNGLPLFKRPRRHDRVTTAAFDAYAHLSHVTVRPSTAVSALSTIHEDVCLATEAKRVAIVILPFHKRWTAGEEVGSVGHGWRAVNQRVLKHAPCSVGVLVDRGLEEVGRVCVVFFGGPDDREALELGGRMAGHAVVKVTVVRFVESEEGLGGDEVTLRPTVQKCSEVNYSFSTAKLDHQREKELDETALSELRSKWDDSGEYVEKESTNIVEGVLTIGRCGEYDLIVVGKCRFPSKMVAELAERRAEHPELGPVGDILASSGQGIVSSVFVIQQHSSTPAEELPVSKVVTATEP